MRARLLIACVACAAASCVASGTLAPNERAIVEVAVEQDVAWRPAVGADFDGLFDSIDVQGPAAAVVREVRYWFGADGGFSGAALIAVPSPHFTTLAGRWTLSDGKLALGEGAEPGTAEVAGDRLRLTGPEGSVVLKRRALP